MNLKKVIFAILQTKSKMLYKRIYSVGLLTTRRFALHSDIMKTGASYGSSVLDLVKLKSVS